MTIFSPKQILGATQTKTAAAGCNDGWEPYKDEKCFKLIESTGTQSFPNAEKTCEINDNSKMISVLSLEEQKFLEEFLFKRQGVVDNVWLGAKSDTSLPSYSFFWVNGGAKLTTFTNWAVGNPKNQSNAGDSCVQMHAEAEQRGQWSNEPCARRNLVVCEKAQSWSMEKMRAMVERVSADHGTIQETVSTLVKGLIPIGFIYTQLPFQKSPQELWPWMVWADDSAQYDSTFFRVAGSRAAAFGAVQEEFSPYIDEIRAYNTSAQSCKGCSSTARLTPNGGWTENLVTAYRYQSATALDQQNNKGGDVGFWNIHTAAGEVRPRNMAVRVWRRTA